MFLLATPRARRPTASALRCQVGGAADDCGKPATTPEHRTVERVERFDGDGLRFVGTRGAVGVSIDAWGGRRVPNGMTVQGVAVAITAGVVAAARGAGAVEHGRRGVTATVLVGNGPIAQQVATVVTGR